ncbi:xanthine dehydrogenase family protein molybdopterin-binding subunit [Actinomadura rudentiformis]|uniref:Xanthine dehydrogenase family protein molybdopterin-binding subunit n=1 Tax=Actinomadura rudentiformis TaxID=359158 RepID=A0A6H9YZU5_9ACTN|nr:xanthine dehydrogenase family protein molybdopterin-binding subunit [Actinomadura rudentiformis]KAB2346979.1 xanthine dehydrogenase family protein molybdopterin-binding subunit [Actinomadura rudentiformis]
MTRQTRPAAGTPLSRVDGRLKVTGQAAYAAEHDAHGAVRGVAHGVIVTSTVGRGRITGIDTRAAAGQRGVLKVISHVNAPELPYRPWRGVPDPARGERLRVFQDDRVRFFGQPVAVVVAETLEIAWHAASLVRVSYDAGRPATDLASPAGEPNESENYTRGNVDQALRQAHVRLDRTYRLQREHHNPMETHATIARWDGDRLTVWDKTQIVLNTRAGLAADFGIPEASVRVISPFVGGAFGSALRCWPHVTIAALAAREVRRPVKVALTRKQMYTGTGFRPVTEYKITLGADQRGRLTATVHDIRAETSTYEDYREGLGDVGRMTHATPNVRLTYRTVPLDINTPTWMRGPGPATAAYAIESAMDELAYELGMDPIELRMRNEPDRDPSTGVPFSTRRLRECFRVGSRTVGWDRRNPRPRTNRDGNWLIGTGVAVATYHTARAAAQALARLHADGTATVQCGTSDMGPGTYTSMTQVAADAIGLQVPRVRFQLGDSSMPPSPPHGGSMTMASVGSAVQDTCDKLRRQAIALAVQDPRSPLHGTTPDDVTVANGRLHLRDNPARGETYQQLLARNNRTYLEARGGYTPGDEVERFSTHAYGAVFAQVAVDEHLGLVRVRQVHGVYDAGRIINPKLADSQAIGGMVGGIGMALLEHTITDPRDGRIVNANMADYLVPTNADIPNVSAIYLGGDDRTADPIGVKGLGEVVIVGVAPAIANAVFHATGRRVRDLPITIESLLGG